MTEQQRRPTLMDVAQAAGVSRALVSIVMRGAPGAAVATRQKVLDAANELGYRPDSRARLLRSTRTKLLGLSFSTAHAFHAEIVDAAYAEASAKGYELALGGVTSGRPEARTIEALLDFGSEALILISPTLSSDELARYAGQVPVVSLLRNDVGERTDSVSSDDYEGIRMAVEHLVCLGQPADRPYRRRHRGLRRTAPVCLPGGDGTPRPGAGHHCWRRDGGRRDDCRQCPRPGHADSRHCLQ
ncbi:DNA-binding LacI/PurR family transcriptional regulator [Arthrobacter globiformis]|nr:DNA-binding LacI/PurR family transcriptional regulator [Arthrobacter globiformis]